VACRDVDVDLVYEHTFGELAGRRVAELVGW
jgi:hypothetical protein